MREIIENSTFDSDRVKRQYVNVDLGKVSIMILKRLFQNIMSMAGVN
jgi:hypothetical protein